MAAVAGTNGTDVGGCGCCGATETRGATEAMGPRDARGPGRSAGRTNAAAALGVRGEALAAEFLESLSMTVLECNWRCKDGELDVVARDGDEIVFVEVKTRSGDGYGMPAEAVTRTKALRIRRLAGQWLAQHQDGWAQVRFDVLGIIAPSDGPVLIEHYVGAF